MSDPVVRVRQRAVNIVDTPPAPAPPPPARLRQRTVPAGATMRTVRKDTGREVSREEQDTIRHPIEMLPARFPGYVRVGGSVTKNMGNFESVNVAVNAELPLPDNLPSTPEGVRQFFPVMSDLVDELLTAELERATGQQFREQG